MPCQNRTTLRSAALPIPTCTPRPGHSWRLGCGRHDGKRFSWSSGRRVWRWRRAGQSLPGLARSKSPALPDRRYRRHGVCARSWRKDCIRRCPFRMPHGRAGGAANGCRRQSARRQSQSPARADELACLRCVEQILRRTWQAARVDRNRGAEKVSFLNTLFLGASLRPTAAATHACIQQQ